MADEHSPNMLAVVMDHVMLNSIAVHTLTYALFSRSITIDVLLNIHSSVLILFYACGEGLSTCINFRSWSLL